MKRVKGVISGIFLIIYAIIGFNICFYVEKGGYSTGPIGPTGYEQFEISVFLVISAIFGIRFLYYANIKRKEANNKTVKIFSFFIGLFLLIASIIELLYYPSISIDQYSYVYYTSFGCTYEEMIALFIYSIAVGIVGIIIILYEIFNGIIKHGFKKSKLYLMITTLKEKKNRRRKLLENELELEEHALEKMAALELKGQDSIYYEKLLLDHQIKEKRYEAKYGVNWKDH